MNTTKLVPARLDFVHDGSGRTVPGRGAAGWTVFQFDTTEEAAAFVLANPQAEMACWRRFEIINGQLVRAR